jgi:hypothetical protein
MRPSAEHVLKMTMLSMSKSETMLIMRKSEEQSSREERKGAYIIQYTLHVDSLAIIAYFPDAKIVSGRGEEVWLRILLSANSTHYNSVSQATRSRCTKPR